MKVEKQKVREKRKENQMKKKTIKRWGRNEKERKAEEPSFWLAIKKRMKSKEGC